MTRRNWWVGAVLAACWAVGGSAESADPRPQPLTVNAPGRSAFVPPPPASASPQTQGSRFPVPKVVTTPGTLAPGAPATPEAGKTKAPTPQEAFAQRVQAAATQQRQRQQLEQQQQALAERNRPTAWQFQNPSGPTNRIPTDSGPNGFLAPNNYFGPQQRTWSNLSAPVSMNQLPFNQTATTPILQSSVPVAPNNYYGPGFARWNQLETSQGRLNPLGGWDYR